MLAARRLGIGLSTLYRKLDDSDKSAAASAGYKAGERQMR